MKRIAGAFLLWIFTSCNDTEKVASATISKEDDLKKAISLYPDSSLLIENLVQFYRDNGEYANAIDIVDKRLKKDSSDINWWAIKATLYFENGDTTLSIDAFEKAISIQPLPKLLISLGTVYAQTRNHKALLVSEALANAPNGKSKKDALFIEGLYYNYTGDKKKALERLEACLSLDHTYMYAYREKAIALYDLTRYSEAVVVLEKAIKLQNAYEEAYYWMGRCLEKLGKVEEAIQSYQTALLYDKNYIEAKEALKKIGS